MDNASIKKKHQRNTNFPPKIIQLTDNNNSVYLPVIESTVSTPSNIPQQPGVLKHGVLHCMESGSYTHWVKRETPTYQQEWGW